MNCQSAISTLRFRFPSVGTLTISSKDSHFRQYGGFLKKEPLDGGNWLLMAINTEDILEQYHVKNN